MLFRSALARGELAGLSIGDFIDAERLPADYIDGLLLPALATIATCTTADARRYPADVVAGYVVAGLSRQSVRRAVHGADDAARLMAGIARVVCDAGVTRVRASAGECGAGAADAASAAQNGVTVLRHRGVQEHFDHAVLATQANQALALWQDAPAAEAQALAGFHYRPLDVVMHRDTRLMPQRRADWSPVNARVCAGVRGCARTMTARKAPSGSTPCNPHCAARGRCSRPCTRSASRVKTWCCHARTSSGRWWTPAVNAR